MCHANGELSKVSLTKHRVDYLTPLFTDFFRKRVRGKGDNAKFKI